MSRLADKGERIRALVQILPSLTDGQIRWIESIVTQFRRPHQFRRFQDSDLVTDAVLQDFGDAVRIHHCFSQEPFSKDKFEYILEQVLKFNGIRAERAPKGNPGHDMTIRKQRFSLKTQADKSIKPHELHISKFHELGKGDWSDRIEDLEGLREQFFNHMKNYDRILSLRTLSKPPKQWHYELVEIPKLLLEEAKNGEFEMKFKSTQMPKPGYCRVYDGEVEFRKKKFELYFNGGGERKLQIKHLDKSCCTVHAEWPFPSETL